LRTEITADSSKITVLALAFILHFKRYTALCRGVSTLAVTTTTTKKAVL
jgi:hypothetical protein